MPTFIPNDRPRRPGTRPPRGPALVVAACLVGVAVSLVVTVQWAPVVGWLFLFFVLASLVANALRRVAHSRWEADAVPVRLAGRTRVIRAIVFVATGTGSALLARALVEKPIVAWFAFVAGGTIGTWIFAAIVVGRRGGSLAPRYAKGPELGSTSRSVSHPRVSSRPRPIRRAGRTSSHDASPPRTTPASKRVAREIPGVRST